MADDLPTLEQVPWEQVLWPLRLPPDVLGSLDWLSGAVFINEDQATFQRVWRDGAADDYEREIVRTVTHETTHYLQVLFMGFLQDWVRRLHLLTFDAVREARGGEQLRSFEDMVSVTNDVPGRVPRERLGLLHAHEAKLDRRHEHGLSVRMLFEGHAVYVELHHGVQYGHAAYLETLNQAFPDPDDRAAYEHARGRLGDDLAYRTFPLVTSLALCASDPVLSFAALVEQVADRAAASDGDVDLDIDALIDRCCGLTFLGSPVADGDFAAAPSYEHPLSTLRRSDDVDVIRFFHEPADEVEALMKLVSPALVLQAEITGGIPLHNYGDDDGRRRAMFGLVQAAWFRAIFDAGSADDAQESARRALDEARHNALAAADNGDVNAFYNLALAAHMTDQPRVALVWFLLAAAQGDRQSLRAAGISLRGGAGDADAQWLRYVDDPAFPNSVPADMWARLGLGVDSDDNKAAGHCYHFAAQLGSTLGVYLHGRRVAVDDPAEGLAYLMLAAGARPLGPGDEVAIAEATARIEELRSHWGRLRMKVYEREARRRLTSA